MKKLLLISFLLCIGMIQAIAYSYTDENGVTWGYSVTGNNATITSASGYGEDVVIPGTFYNGTTAYTVTVLRYSIFQGNTNIQNVTLPSSVVTIEYNCFNGCTNLKEINLSSCTSIGNNAFAGCSNLGNVTLSSELKSIGTRAFQSCNSMTSITIASVAEIQSWAFEWCKGLETVIIGEGVKTIGIRAFNECTALKEVTILGGDTLNVNGEAFRSCTALEKVTMPTTPFILHTSAFSGGSSLKSINLNACVSLSDGSQFNGCSSLETIGGLESCTVIGGSAFQKCSSLKSVGDLGACAKIYDYAFSGCTSLKSVGDMSACTVIYNYAFSGCTSLESVGDMPVCTEIKGYAFQNCSSLKTVGDLHSLRNIQNNVLSGCYLEKIVLAGDSVVTLGEALSTPTTVFVPQKLLAAYKETNKWKDMIERILPIGVETESNITVSAMDNASNIALKIGEDNLENIMSLTISGTINSYDILVMRNKMPNLHHLDMTNVSIVANAANYLESYHTSNNTLGRSCFNGMKKLMTVKLPKSITEIEQDAFIYCANLENVEFTEDILTIGQGAFYQCGNLRSVELKNGLVTIGKSAFDGCKRLENCVIPEGVQTINSYAFQDCAMERIDIPIGVKTIGYRAFRWCRNMKNLIVGSGCETIGSEAFYGCSNLEKAVVGEEVNTIGESAFSCCGKLASIQLPSTLTSIGRYAFSGTNLLSLSLPLDLATIGEYAFQNNANLEVVSIPAMVSSIGNYAFSGCSSLKDVYVFVLEPQSIAQNTFSTYQTTTLHVPTTSYYSYYYNTQWSQFANLVEFSAPYRRFFFADDYTLDDIQGVIDTEEDSECNIHAGAGLTVNTQQDSQYIGTIHVMNDGTKGGSLIAHNNMSAKQVNFEMAIAKTTWYFLCVPYRVKLENVEAPGHYVFRYYDGATRAEKGSGGWKDLPEGTTHLLPGYGYIFQCDQAGTLVLKAMEEDLDFSGTDQSLGLVSHTASSIQNASWNYMGNPFTSYYDIDDTGYESPITVWNGRSYDAVRPGDDDYHLRPLQAFFVQKPENVDEIVFDADNRETYLMAQTHSAAKTVRCKVQGVKSSRFIVNLELGDANGVDKTRIVYNDGRTTAYELDCDAAKFMSSGVPQLYSLGLEQERYAINERPLGNVDLGYVVYKRGQYHIAATRMDRHMLLRDNELGLTFDLANGEYTFNSDAGTFDKRFTLVVSDEAMDIARLEEQTGVRITIGEGGLVLDGITADVPVSIYTMAGVMVATPSSNGLVSLPSGTYIVKVNALASKVVVK